jgi:hypothetical protein
VRAGVDEGTRNDAWWKKAVIHQIYPRSFYDGTSLVRHEPNQAVYVI